MPLCRLWRVAAIAALSAPAACGYGGPAYREGPSAADGVVVMTSTLAFDPATVTIPAGGMVEWRNTSLFTHTVRSDDTPSGAIPFQSGNVPQGGIYSHTFTVPGIYRYHCDPHGNLGMEGRIVVLDR